MSNSRYTRTTTDVLSLRFNQDSSCFICATCDGIRIFNVEPFAQKSFLDVGRVTYAEMLYRTNLIAYVPADHVTGLPSNVVNVYDDERKTHVLELCFSLSVVSIRMSRTRLIVVLVSKIHIFSFPNQCRLLHTIETKDNPRGLCELSNNDGSLLVFPFNAKTKGGFVQFLNMNGIENDMSYNPRIIQAHTSELAAIALNQMGTLLATASKRGTLIRVFSTTGLCEKLYEFRRGSDTADIHSIAFSFDSSFLCVSSDKGTVHLYGIRDPKLNRMVSIHHALNEAFGDLCNFKVAIEWPCICAFSGPSHVIAASFDGTFHKHIFTTDGKCNREEFELYLDGIDGCDF
ncbi:hypothetical protein I4U23_009573 [Adineta vaga]|nr:hypothetical protein I4U23_009573 [Adineta vaga]